LMIKPLIFVWKLYNNYLSWDKIILSTSKNIK